MVLLSATVLTTRQMHAPLAKAHQFTSRDPTVDSVDKPAPAVCGQARYPQAIW